MSYNLRQLIEILEGVHPAKRVVLGFRHAHSYRGYYEDLAFEPAENVEVREMLTEALESVGKTFEGYKGGEFTMSLHSTVWLSKYGEASGQTLGPWLIKAMLGLPPFDHGVW